MNKNWYRGRVTAVALGRARHAGVGVGTVYRRLRTKEELVEALFVSRIDSVAAAAEAPDPWSGLVSFMEQMVEMLDGDVGLQPTDIAFIIFTLAEATQFGRAVSPQIWRRYFNIFLDGLRPEREGVTPLPVPALLPEEMESTMRLNAPRHR